MAYFENYQESAIVPAHVDREGNYELMILGTESGTTKDGSRYLRVICKINYQGEPRVSIFLTEGDSFDGNFTAFCDTFGIPRGNTNFESWKFKRGFVFIALQKKGEYLNMVPKWILNRYGFVERQDAPLTPEQIAQKVGGEIISEEDNWNSIPFNV